MKLAISAVTLLLSSSAVALAADLAPQIAEPAVPVYTPFTWSGFYVGAQAGYAWGSSDTRVVAVGLGHLANTSNDPDGAFGGFHAGYNYQFGGNFVIGAEGDINIADIKSSGNRFISTGLIAPPGAPIPVDLDFKQEWFGSARLRAGYAFDRLLPYVTGGLAFGEMKVSINGVGDNVVTASSSDTRVGWTLGAGLEYAFTDNITARLEYRYTDYGTAGLAVNASNGTSGRLSPDLKINNARVGVSYKF